MRRGKAWAGLVAGAIALADGVSYLIVIHRQGDPGVVVPWVFSLIALGALAAFGGWFLSPGSAASFLLGGSAVVLGALGVLGLLSIGVPLLIASAFSLAGVPRARGQALPVGRPGRVALVGLAAVGMLLAGVFIVGAGAGGTSVTVTCSGSGEGAGMPTVQGAASGHGSARPHACRTILAP
jgi:hypothetical protein